MNTNSHLSWNFPSFKTLFSYRVAWWSAHSNKRIVKTGLLKLTSPTLHLASKFKAIHFIVLFMIGCY